MIKVNIIIIALKSIKGNHQSDNIYGVFSKRVSMQVFKQFKNTNKHSVMPLALLLLKVTFNIL